MGEGQCAGFVIWSFWHLMLCKVRPKTENMDFGQHQESEAEVMLISPEEESEKSGLRFYFKGK